MVEIGQEDIRVGSGFDGHGGDHPLQAHRSDDRKDFPVALWRGLVNTTTAQAAPAMPRHAHHDSAFIQENQPFRRNGQDALMKLGASLTVGFRVSLDGVDRLFLRRRPSRLTQFCVRVQLIATPLSA